MLSEHIILQIYCFHNTNKPCIDYFLEKTSNPMAEKGYTIYDYGHS